MPMFDTAYLEKLDAYFDSGDLEQDFEFADDEKRGRILDFLERLMDLADKADQLATKVIFKDSEIAALMGANTQK